MARTSNILMASCAAFVFSIGGGLPAAHATHFAGGEIIYRGGFMEPPGPQYSGAGVIDIELVALSLTSSDPAGQVVPLPPDGSSFIIDSFFDVDYEIRIGGNNFTVDSFFDIEYSVSNPPGGDTGYWETEMVSLSLSGDIPGGPSIVIRESPVLPSPGEIRVTDLPDGTFRIDSFFDVFTEISVDGGPFQPASGPPMRLVMDATPEPASLALLGMGTAALTARRRSVV